MSLPGNPGDHKTHDEVERQNNQQLNIRASERPLNDKEGAKQTEDRSGCSHNGRGWRQPKHRDRAAKTGKEKQCDKPAAPHQFLHQCSQDIERKTIEQKVKKDDVECTKTAVTIRHGSMAVRGGQYNKSSVTQPPLSSWAA